MRRVKRLWGVMLAVMAIGPTAPVTMAQTFNSGSTGADGPFSPSSNTTVTLPANGIFNFTTVNISSGVTVTFLGNQANTPVFMLATGDVAIAGTINLDGATGPSSGSGFRAAPNGGAGGAGGYAGGSGGDGSGAVLGGAGLGSGGGKPGSGCGHNEFFNVVTDGCGGGGGGFAGAGGNGGGGNPIGAGGASYGNELNLPLIGGSGGAGGGSIANVFGAGGGGGGGAILIASTTRITLTGTISAKGGNRGSCDTSGAGGGGGGSGGAIRIVATTLAGTGGTITVVGGPGSPSCSSGFGTGGGSGAAGRIRLEGYTITMTATMTGSITSGTPGSVFLPGNPTLAITRIGGVNVAGPRGSFGTPDITLPVGTANPVTVELAATNIPITPPVTVTVTVAPLSGQPTNYASSALAGTDASSSASASVTLPTTQVAVLSASATFNVVLAGGQPLRIDGEEVEKIKVAALPGRPTQRFYITKAGREIPIP